MKAIAKILGCAAATTVIFTLGSCSNDGTSSAAGEAGNKADSTAKAEIPEGSIVYFQMDRVVEEYDMANDKKSEVEAKVAGIQKEVDRRRKSLENAVADFNNKINKGLITSAVAATTQKKLQQQEATFQQFAQEKQAEVMEEQQVLVNQILEAIKVYVEQYNIDKGYPYIIANQGGMPVITADPTFDITDEIISGLNAEYVETKKLENNSQEEGSQE